MLSKMQKTLKHSMIRINELGMQVLAKIIFRVINRMLVEQDAKYKK